MANGQQLAEKNFNMFVAWLASKSADEFRGMVSRGVLSRKEIAKECGFAQSALNQNPRIKSALLAKEVQLRDSGVLPALAGVAGEAPAPLMREPGSNARSFDIERLRRLEQENASLRAENGQLKRELERYAVLREALSTAGRLLR